MRTPSECRSLLKSLNPDPVVATFKTYANLSLPNIASLEGAKAFNGLNEYWLGSKYIPDPTPEYLNSDLHLEATYSMTRGRMIEIEVQVHASGAWTIKPQELHL